MSNPLDHKGLKKSAEYATQVNVIMCVISADSQA